MARYIERTNTVYVDGEEVPGRLTVERNTVEIPPSMLPEPDPDWTYTDTTGHKHHYDHGYPTMKRVVTGRWWCADCHEHHEHTTLACRWCGEHIVPDTRPPSPFPTYVDAGISWTVEVDRYYKRGGMHRIEAGGYEGDAVVVTSAIGSSGGSATMAGASELSEAASSRSS